MESEDYRYYFVKLKEWMGKQARGLFANECRVPDKIRHFSWILYENESLEDEGLKGAQKLNKSLTGLFIIIAAVFILAWITGGTGNDFSELLVRESAGGNVKTIPVILNMKRDELELSVSGSVDVQPVRISEENCDRYFDLCESWLDSVVLKDNESFTCISSELFLPDVSEDGLIQLFWFMSEDCPLNSYGQPDLLRCKDGDQATLYCAMRVENCSREISYQLTFMPGQGNMSAYLADAGKTVMKQLSSNSSGPALELPLRMDDIELSWTNPSSGAPVFIPALGLLAALFLYFSRFDSLEKSLKDRASAVDESISDISLQLILLLNSGLVVNRAFEQLLENNKDSNNPLLIHMAVIMNRCRAENLYFPGELYAFAGRGNSRQLMRFASLIYENSSTGAELCKKLENERKQQWNSRLNKAEARAKEAETRLCFPLMLLLLVLVLISVSPALINM